MSEMDREKRPRARRGVPWLTIVFFVVFAATSVAGCRLGVLSAVDVVFGMAGGVTLTRLLFEEGDD